MDQWTLSSLARELRESPGWAEQERVTRILVKEPAVRVLVVGLPAGARWPQHKSAARVIVTVMEGRLDFATANDVRTLTSGDIVTLEPAVPHDLHAHEDTVFLLTIAGPAAPVQIG